MSDMEHLIEECGGFGKYQVFILFGICIQKLSVAWTIMQMSYAGYTPDFHCMGPTTGNASHWTNRTSSLTLNKCSLNNSDTGYLPTDCLSYQFVGNARTIMTEWNLVCDMKWVKATITSIQMAGVLVGAMFAGQLADLIGRRRSLFGFVLLHSLLHFGTAFCSSWQMFSGFAFALGVGAGAVMVISTPYPMEFLPIKWRPIITVIPMMAIGVCLMALAAFIYEDWTYLHIAAGVFGLPFLICYSFVPESVRWLTLQGRNKEAEKVIARMAAVNGRPKPQQTAAVLKAIFEAEKLSSAAHGEKYTYGDLFKSKYLAKRTLAFCFLWFSSAMAVYGISFGAGSLAGNVELNIFLVTIVDQPSVFCTFYLNNRFGRKRTCLGLYSLALLGGCACFVVQFLDIANKGAFITGFSLFAKMGIGAALACVGVWSTESFPTVVRSVGSGIVNAAAKLGGIAAPFVVDLDSHPKVAYASMAGLFLISMLVCLVIPESKGRNLSDSINTLVVSPPDGSHNENGDVTGEKVAVNNGVEPVVMKDVAQFKQLDETGAKKNGVVVTSLSYKKVDDNGDNVCTCKCHVKGHNSDTEKETKGSKDEKREIANSSSNSSQEVTSDIRQNGDDGVYSICQRL